MLREFLIKAAQLGVSLDAGVAQKLLIYLELLRKWNKVHNLCAEASYKKMLAYHILDSISVAGVLNLKNRRCLDVGTGAGLPGLLLAIVEPQCNMVLLDSKLKKITFINHAINVLRITNVITKQARVESFKAESPFDMVFSRAFSSLVKFVEVSHSLCAENGILVTMKAEIDRQENSKQLQKNIDVLKVFAVKVPGVASQRTIVVLGKNKHKNAIEQQGFFK